MKTIESSSRVTARQNLVKVLAQEILSGTYDPRHPIPSEHQLCRRFGVSRVTVRLALGDLQHSGLIYRHHGKGTFIHGASKMAGKPLAILMRRPAQESCPSLSELIRGFQSYLASSDSYSVTIGVAPSAWTPSMATSLGGVLVIPDGVLLEDLENLNKRNLPYLIAGASELPGPTLQLGTAPATHEVVSKLLEQGQKHFAFIHGTDAPYDRLKLEGITKALSHSNPAEVSLKNIESASNYDALCAAAGQLFQATPQPQVVLASESEHVAVVLAEARKRGIEIGRDLKVVTYSSTPLCRILDPSIITIDLAFKEGGQQAAKALGQASLSIQPLESISLPYQIHWPA